MKMFEPDYRHVIDAANNIEAERLPLYEHGFDAGVVEKIIGEPVQPLLDSTYENHIEAQRRIARCGIQLGYDVIPFERPVCAVVQNAAGLCGRAPSLIETMEDLDAYPWEKKVEEFVVRFEAHYQALREALPEGMKAVGGIGNGLFETVQDFVPFQELSYLHVDEPEVYEALWRRVGDLQIELWKWLLENHRDSFAVCRFGDDLGFRSSTLIQPNEIRRHVLPQYKRIVDLVHSYGKPFLLHSCGRIYDVMDDIIGEVGIDAKHSNEDAIDRFDVWVERYGKRIGNFGGVEMNIMTLNTPAEVRRYVLDLLDRIGTGNGGIGIGTGNQISSYTEPANWVAMCEAVREWRGDL
jgi:uroporphyrinogen decarboxylase